jgi:hypothetical protein
LAGKKKVLITTFGKGDKTLNAALQTLSFDRLVVVCGDGSREPLPDLRKRLGEQLEVVELDAFSYIDCLREMKELIGKHSLHEVKVNMAGGPKPLSFAALVACLNLSVPCFQADVHGLVEIPPLPGVELGYSLKKDAIALLTALDSALAEDEAKKRSGLSGRRFDIAVAALKRRRLLAGRVEGGTPVYELTELGHHYRVAR